MVLITAMWIATAKKAIARFDLRKACLHFFRWAGDCSLTLEYVVRRKACDILRMIVWYSGKGCQSAMASHFV